MSNLRLSHDDDRDLNSVQTTLFTSGVHRKLSGATMLCVEEIEARKRENMMKPSSKLLLKFSLTSWESNFFIQFVCKMLSNSTRWLFFYIYITVFTQNRFYYIVFYYIMYHLRIVFPRGRN